MNRKRGTSTELLRQFLVRFFSPSNEESEAARVRILDRLRQEEAHPTLGLKSDVALKRGHHRPAFVLAGTVLAFVLLLLPLLLHDKTLRPGQTVHSNEDGTFVVLPDGSSAPEVQNCADFGS
jgi:hypothetical protein